MKPPQVLIIGAGIIGASIAWHLARAGTRVTVIDASEPGGIATRNSWAWINASWGNPDPYFRLRVRAMADWHRLEREVPDIRRGATMSAWSSGPRYVGSSRIWPSLPNSPSMRPQRAR